MTDPIETLTYLADSLDGCEWNHPLGAAETCRLAADALDKMLHRRCHDCGHEAYYTDCTIPECCCERCGSADTRLVKPAAPAAKE
jgi:hypothetical protein